MDDQHANPMAYKRVKRAVDVEKIVHQSAYLNRYALQRQTVTGIQKARYLKGLRKAGRFDIT